VLVFRCVAEDEIASRGEFAQLRALEGLESHDDGFPLLLVSDAVQDAVPRVGGVAFDIKLGREQLAVALLDLDVDVWRPPRIGDRLDGPEPECPVGCGFEAAEALKVLVSLVAVVLPWCR
jgi:hypothetical protein